MHSGKRPIPSAAIGDEAPARFSIAGVEFSVARLILPETDSEATVVVGEMTLAAEALGLPSRKVIAIRTAVERVGTEPDAHAEPRRHAQRARRTRR